MRDGGWWDGAQENNYTMTEKKMIRYQLIFTEEFLMFYLK